MNRRGDRLRKAAEKGQLDRRFARAFRGLEVADDEALWRGGESGSDPKTRGRRNDRRRRQGTRP